MNGRAVVLSLVTVLAAGLVALFLSRYEKEDYEFFVEPRGGTPLNPLLAAQRFLTSLDYEVIERDHFAPSIELPGPQDTVLLMFSYEALREEEMDYLLRWIAQGGHLIVRISAFPSTYDPIFTAIGVKAVFRNEDKVPNDETVTPQAPWDAAANPGRQDWGNVLPDNGVNIDFGDNQPIWTVRDQFGPFAGQLAYEQGAITAIADTTIFSNRWIAREDHAYLLTRVIGPGATSGRVWLVHDFGYPSLWSLVVERAYFLLAAGALLLILLLWWAGQRFGPPIAPPRAARKAFVEHIEASGRFLWRHQRHGQLLLSTQRAFLNDAQRRHPRLRSQDDDERNLYLASCCDVSVDAVADALATHSTRSQGDFLRRVRTLKTMWKNL